MKISQGWRICSNSKYPQEWTFCNIKANPQCQNFSNNVSPPILLNSAPTWQPRIHILSQCCSFSSKLSTKAHSSWFVTTPRTVFSSMNCLFVLDGHRKMIRLWTSRHFEPKILWYQFFHQQPLDSLFFECTSTFLIPDKSWELSHRGKRCVR